LASTATTASAFRTSTSSRAENLGADGGFCAADRFVTRIAMAGRNSRSCQDVVQRVTHFDDQLFMRCGGRPFLASTEVTMRSLVDAIGIGGDLGASSLETMSMTSEIPMTFSASSLIFSDSARDAGSQFARIAMAPSSRAGRRTVPMNGTRASPASEHSEMTG
jgi:hypothetical protein